MKILKTVILCGFTALAITACDPIYEEKGYRLDTDQIAKVEAGIATKDSVLETLGSPSSVATFPEQGEAWYYISRSTEHFAFLEKTVLEQNVIVIKFDENDVVSEIKNYDKADRREIEMVDRKTPTGGNELGFFEQIFGNFGRFNTGAQ
ncbi:MAG: outer membrane protein assembly factor BamE [Sneathiella sp.]|nr:outer membrane protein assembly factor BamE [Sneathiella sp.]